MYTLMIKGKFDAAHFLPDYDGKCKNVHGHTWHIKAGFKYVNLYEEGSRNGMGQDFNVLKKQLNVSMDHYDHQLLNDLVEFVPTAENIARDIYDSLRRMNPNIVWIEVWETEGAGVRYEPSGGWPKPTKEAFAPVRLGGKCKDEP